jgi:hypothetical protein
MAKIERLCREHAAFMSAHMENMERLDRESLELDRKSLELDRRNEATRKRLEKIKVLQAALNEYHCQEDDAVKEKLKEKSVINFSSCFVRSMFSC